jgi:hypothetical protein
MDPLLTRPALTAFKSASEISDVDSAYDASDDGSYGVEVVKDVLASSVSSVSEEEVSESSGSVAEKDEAGFVDPFPDFQWMTTEEPHRSRRMAILKAHPEVSLKLSIHIYIPLTKVGPETDGSDQMDVPRCSRCPFFPISPRLHSAPYIALSLDLHFDGLCPWRDTQPKYLPCNP